MAETPEDIEKKLGLDRSGRQIPLWVKYVVGGSVVALGILYWISVSDEDRGVRYITTPATTGDLRVLVTATGTIEPTNLVEVSSELSGTLETVNVDFNDIVQQGSVLAELDTTKLEARLAVSKAALDSAIARVAIAEATLEDMREKYENALQLEEQGVTARQAFISQRAAFIRAQAELQSARADRALAEADVDLNQAELDKACICSPIDGIVLDRAVDPGQIVAATLSAPILFTIAEDLTRMELQIDIDEADIGRTEVGNKAVFTVDAYDERSFPSEISEIRFAPKTVDGVVTYKAVLTVDNSDLSLRPGMTATADIIVAEIYDALVVPNAALRYAPPIAPTEEQERSGLLGMLIPDDQGAGGRGDDKTLWVLRNDQPQEIDILAGPSDGRMTQILNSDLEPGDRVIVDRIDG